MNLNKAIYFYAYIKRNTSVRLVYSVTNLSSMTKFVCKNLLSKLTFG